MSLILNCASNNPNMKWPLLNMIFGSYIQGLDHHLLAIGPLPLCWSFSYLTRQLLRYSLGLYRIQAPRDGLAGLGNIPLLKEKGNHSFKDWKVIDFAESLGCIEERGRGKFRLIAQRCRTKRGVQWAPWWWLKRLSLLHYPQSHWNQKPLE